MERASECQGAQAEVGFVPPRSFLGERVGGAQSVDERVLSTGGDSVVVLLGVEADSVLHEYFI